MHYIYLAELPPTKGWPEVIPAGYYQGNRHNWPLYSRGPKETAILVTRETAISIVKEARNLGYGCKAEPSITVIY